MFKRARTNTDDLPREAYAITGDPHDPKTWQLPHHTRAIIKNGHRENNVNWSVMDTAAEYLSLQGHNGKRVEADLEQIIMAAKHLAGHYAQAGKPIPRDLTPML